MGVSRVSRARGEPQRGPGRGAGLDQGIGPGQGQGGGQGSGQGVLDDDHVGQAESVEQAQPGIMAQPGQPQGHYPGARAYGQDIDQGHGRGHQPGIAPGKQPDQRGEQNPLVHVGVGAGRLHGQVLGHVIEQVAVVAFLGEDRRARRSAEPFKAVPVPGQHHQGAHAPVVDSGQINREQGIKESGDGGWQKNRGSFPVRHGFQIPPDPPGRVRFCCNFGWEATGIQS